MLSLRGSFQSVGQANTKQDDIKCQQCRLQPIRNVTSCMNTDRSFANCVMPLNLCSKTSSHILFYSYMQKMFITLLNLKAISMRSKRHLFLFPGFILRHNIILNMPKCVVCFFQHNSCLVKPWPHLWHKREHIYLSTRSLFVSVRLYCQLEWLAQNCHSK